MRVRCILENNLSPMIKHRLCDVQLPVDLVKEYAFVRVDLANSEARHLTPGFS